MCVYLIVDKHTRCYLSHKECPALGTTGLASDRARHSRFNPAIQFLEMFKKHHSNKGIINALRISHDHMLR